MTIYQLKPQSQDQRNVSQGDILNNFTYLQTSVGHDHNFTNDSTATNDGLHKHSTYFVTTAPVTATDQVATYTANDAYAQPQLWMQPFNSAVTLNPIQLTAGNPTTGATQVPQKTITSPTVNSGVSFLPGGWLIQWGLLTATDNALIEFPVAFSNTFTPSVFCTLNGSGTIGFCNAGSITNSNFRANVRTSSGGTFPGAQSISYYSIGLA